MDIRYKVSEWVSSVLGYFGKEAKKGDMFQLLCRLFFFLCLWVVGWCYLGEYYSKGVSRVADSILRGTTPIVGHKEAVERLVAVEKYKFIGYSPIGKKEGPDRPIMQVNRMSFDYNVILLSALLSATPGLGSVRRRLGFISLGMVLLFALQTFFLTVMVKNIYANELGAYSAKYYSEFWQAFYDYGMSFLATFGVLFLPWLIWVGMCYGCIMDFLGIKLLHSESATGTTGAKGGGTDVIRESGHA